MPALTYADGLLVLHKGRIIYEKYFGAGEASRPHIAFSVTKSIVGTLAVSIGRWAARGDRQFLLDFLRRTLDAQDEAPR